MGVGKNEVGNKDRTNEGAKKVIWEKGGRGTRDKRKKQRKKEGKKRS